MNKYAIIETNTVTNVIKSGEAPVGVTSIDITNDTTGISYGWKHDGSNFISPLSYNDYQDNSISIDTPSISISCSFNRGCDEITSSDISFTNPNYNISNVNWDSSNNILSFNLDTGSESNFGEDFNSYVLMPKSHADTHGYTWGISDLLVDIKN